MESVGVTFDQGWPRKGKGARLQFVMGESGLVVCGEGKVILSEIEW